MSSLSDQFEKEDGSSEIEMEEYSGCEKQAGDEDLTWLETSEEEQPPTYVCAYECWMERGVAKRQLLIDNEPAGPTETTTSIDEDVTVGEEFIATFLGGDRLKIN